MREAKVDQLTVRVYPTRLDMGQAAAQDGLAKLRTLLKQKEQVNVVFAAAPSQSEMLETLTAAQDIDWQRVHAFHMDNYIGLPQEAPQQFSTFLKDRLFNKLPFGAVHLMGNTPADAENYAQLLREHPLDICFLGIGENGHIAFNDPGVADFDDPYLVKMVELDEVCRNQQVNDGCFETLAQVPTHALTMTIPAMVAAKHMICTVPGKSKAWAVREMLTQVPSSQLPATVLRRHTDSVLYIDQDAAALWEAQA
ncbi:MAG: glucosamine-6-phosphate deaminase [Christensenellales bacterium]|jgi:glucosamine-6-phosphate deaminase